MTTEKLQGKDLIGYCKIHMKTDLALFHKSMVYDMFMLAGYEENDVKETMAKDGREWLYGHNDIDMEKLISQAEANL